MSPSLRRLPLFRSLLGSLLALAGIVVWRTQRMPSRQPKAAPGPLIALNAEALAKRLAKTLAFQTVAGPDGGAMDPAPFKSLKAYLREAFPRVHGSLACQEAGHSLLYTWKGRDPSLPAVVLMAHLDVVPADPRDGWSYPPFEENVREGFVWGRGALDDKASLMAILEAVEWQLDHGFQPTRTVILAFGEDEEVGGPQGAKRLAALIRDSGQPIASVLDEGEVIAVDLVPGIKAPVALIGTAEKGYLTLRMRVKGEGGHSSMPPRESAVGILSRALLRLEGHPFPARIVGPVSAMFEDLAPEMGFGARMAFANRWLFSPVLERSLGAAPSTNALIRTTIAATVLRAGNKDNVLPTQAEAMINVRILPGETSTGSLERLRFLVGDARIEWEADLPSCREPSPVANPTGAAYGALAQTIRDVFPGTLVAPSLVLGGTDSYHFRDLTPEIFRFVPFRARPADLARFHGPNERIAVTDYVEGVRFYISYLERTASEESRRATRN